jgi:hypothetical protein
LTAASHSVESRRDQGKRPKFARIYPSHTFRCASVHCVANEASKARALSTRRRYSQLFWENASPNQNLFVTAIYNPAGIPPSSKSIYTLTVRTQVSLLLLNVGFQGGSGVVLLGRVFVAHFDSDVVRPGWLNQI